MTVAAEEYDEGDACVVTSVGGVSRIVDLALFLETHADLADRFRAQGLVGNELDVAIIRAMPMALSAKLDGISLAIH
ncbi:MAG: hypothetical protein AB7E84_06360 [Xanthobacteraceae bacterium]